MNNIGIDWVSLVIVVIAFAVSRFSTMSIRQQNVVNAVAMFSIVGWRLYSMGTAGTNALITGAAGVLGIISLVRAFRSA